MNTCFLNETWIKIPNDSLFSLINEYSYRLFHSNKYGKGKGTAMIINKNICYGKVEFHEYEHFTTFT